LDPIEPPDPSVHLFGNDYVWKQAGEPMDSGVDQVDGVSADTATHSLMLRFGKEVAAAVGVPVAIIPAPRGGTNLYAQWQRDADDPTNRGTLYGSALHRVLSQGYAHPIKGVIWYQGESDVGWGYSVYLGLLEQLVADFRIDLANPDLFFGNCQLATLQDYDAGTPAENFWLQIQEAQRYQADNDPLSVAVGLVDQPRSDGVHLSVLGYREVGRRLAAAVVDEFYGVPQSLGPQRVSIGFDGSTRLIAIDYDKPLSGGDAGLYRVEDQTGVVDVSSVKVSGTRVTIRLRQNASGPTTVSYGFADSPAAPWLVGADGAGAALTFWRMAVEP
jgi:hypothetical protein